MSEPAKPHRRFDVTINVCADDWETLQQTLDDIARDYFTNRRDTWDVVSGGPDRGWWIDGRERPEMTNERYHAELKEYLTALRRSRDPGTGGAP